jgi:hypothetical protein
MYRITHKQQKNQLRHFLCVCVGGGGGGGEAGLKIREDNGLENTETGCHSGSFGTPDQYSRRDVFP